MARALHRLSSVGASAVVVAAVLAPVGLVPVPALASYELRFPRAAGGYSRSKTYVTVAGTFKASFHAHAGDPGGGRPGADLHDGGALGTWPGRLR